MGKNGLVYLILVIVCVICYFFDVSNGMLDFNCVKNGLLWYLKCINYFECLLGISINKIGINVIVKIVYGDCIEFGMLIVYGRF